MENNNGQQRHLSDAFSNSVKKKTTVKGRIEEIERRTFNNLHRRTPQKVNRSKVKLKSPILRYKQPTSHQKVTLSSSKVLSSAKKNIRDLNQGIMDTKKVRRIIENFDSNLKDTTPKKNLNIDGGLNCDDSKQMDTHKNAFELLMGAKGDA